MGFFKGLICDYKKSEASIVVRDLLKQNSMFFALDKKLSEDISQKLVDDMWDALPEIFNGDLVERPHKLVVAASALAYYVVECANKGPFLTIMARALGTLLSNIESNRHLYSFNSTDFKLIGFAENTYSNAVDWIESSYATWDEWFLVFKEEAGKVNPILRCDENGFSLFDGMDNEPVQRAFRDGIDPVSLAKDFAAQFDLSKMRVV